MFRKLILPFSATALVACALLFTGCSPQPNHPNQLNRFDGAAYDSLVLAHGSLASLRTSVAERYPSLTPKFNNVADAYRAAVTAYSLYRSNASMEFTASTALHNLTLSLILLEGEIEATLRHGSGPAALTAAAASTSNSPANASSQPAYPPSELMTVLEFAAAIAGAIPETQHEADAAQTILAATRQALTEWKASSSAPIDLDLLPPIESLN